MAGEAYAAEDVYFEQALPGIVCLIEEAYGFVDAEVVNKDIHFRKLSNGLCGAGGGAVVGSKFFQLRARHAGTDVGDGGFNASGGTSVDYHRNAFTGKGRSYFFTDAAGGGGDKGERVIELKVHEGLFPQRLMSSREAVQDT
jgi:hypothetical protein